jgi:hypothetical protein
VKCEGEEGNLKKRRGRPSGLVVGLASPTSSPFASSIPWCVLCLEHDSMNASLDALSVGKLAGVLDDSVCMNNRGWMVVESEMWK